MIAFVLANVLGVVGIVWPIALGVSVVSSENQAHATDAPILIALLVPLLVIVAIDAARRGERNDARVIALLGALVAINAFLRIPKGPWGEGLVFILPILAGWYIGARFGFLLGAFTILASSVITGGIGPWVPFQMFGLGWVGAGAGLARKITKGKAPRITLGAYAYMSSIAYGFVLTLWFWPFLGSHGRAFFSAGAPATANLVRFWRFYLLTSLPWDTGRAILANVPLVVILARPVGDLFERVRDRFGAEVLTPAVRPFTIHMDGTSRTLRP
jgi:energy-coupling factor transport system substrate-specific component